MTDPYRRKTLIDAAWTVLGLGLLIFGTWDKSHYGDIVDACHTFGGAAAQSVSAPIYQQCSNADDFYPFATWAIVVGAIMFLVGAVVTWQTASSQEARSAASKNVAMRAALSSARGMDTRTCLNSDCEQYGLPQAQERCPSCGATTAEVSGRRQREPAAASMSTVSTPVRAGARECPDPLCGEGGLRTDDVECAQCGSATVAWSG